MLVVPLEQRRNFYEWLGLKIQFEGNLIASASEVLLFTDATPQGRRTAYAYIANRLLKRGVQVHTLSNGWCPPSARSRSPAPTTR